MLTNVIPYTFVVISAQAGIACSGLQLRLRLFRPTAARLLLWNFIVPRLSLLRSNHLFTPFLQKGEDS
jgi:hypothetical protein